eukprot:COSAG06_NODE_64200_length_260_cov_0.639752_1_plen_41_part_01
MTDWERIVRTYAVQRYRGLLPTCMATAPVSGRRVLLPVPLP